MTIVVAVIRDGLGVMACDSMVTNAKGGSVIKTWQHGHVAYGFCGNVAVGQRLRQRLPSPPEQVTPHWLTVNVAPRLQRAKSDVSLIVAAPEGVWTIDEHGAVIAHDCGYAAIGSGADIALGALHATQTADPEVRASAAIRAACRHCPDACALPGVVMAWGGPDDDDT